MYLRETKRKNAGGSIARYYQLAENEWDKGKGCAIADAVCDRLGSQGGARPAR